MYWNLELTGSAEEELAPFVAALGVLTLAACGDPQVPVAPEPVRRVHRPIHAPSGRMALLAESPERSRQPQPLLPGGAVAPLGAVRHEPRMSAHGAGRPGKIQDLAGPVQRSRRRGRGQRGERQRRRLSRPPRAGMRWASRRRRGWPAWSGKGMRRGAPTTTPTPWICTTPWPAPANGACPRSRTSGLCSWTGSRPVVVRTAGTATRCAPRAPSPPCTSSAPRRRAKRCGPRSSGSCAGNGRTEAGRSTASGRGPCRRIPHRWDSPPQCSTPLRASRPLVRSIPFPADPEPDVRREPSEVDAPETGHAQASREPALRSSSGTGTDGMQERKIVRGGTPIVCLASQSAFQQEAGVHLALSADHSGSPVPRISIEIVPDPAAEEPRPAKPAGKQGKKHD